MKVLLGIALGFVLQLNAQVAQIVGIVASDPEAREISPLLDIPENPAVFQVWRHGPTNGPLTVLLSVGGTASNGVDYEFISNSVTIPAGSFSTEIFVSVIDDQLVEGTETVVLTLQTSPCLSCYDVGTNSTALAYILDDEATNAPPIVWISRPHDGESFVGPTNILLRAVANDPDDGHDISVEFFSGDNRIGAATFIPSLCPEVDCPSWDLIWSNVPPGHYTLTARATDKLGATSVSAPVHITVESTTNLAPTVAITAPTNGAVLPAGRDVHIEAVTVDPDGYADTVTFFADDKQIGEVTVLFIQAPPPGSPINFEFTWTNPPPGGHVLTAATVDALGARGTSAPVRIFVTTETNRPPDYTVVSVVALDAHAQEPGNAAADTGQFAVRRTGNLSSDVTVFYGIGGSASNGTDYVAISNRVVIPAGQTQAVINIVPLPDAQVEGTETAVLELHPPVCAAVFPPPPGCYVVGSPGRATVFIADASAPTNRPPMVELVNPPDGSIFPAPANILLIAHANDPDGYETVRSVEFFAGSNSLGLRTNYPTANPIGPFFLIWSNVTAGNYALTARATDLAGASTASAPIHVRVVDVTGTNRPPIWPWPRLRIPPQCLAEVRTNGCRLLLGADTPMTCVIESTVDLLRWTPICTNTLSAGEIELRDCEGGSAPMRFYRVRQE